METKNCQNCKNDFNIEPNDFSFYEKIKVPPPTFCPDCRRVRRMAWRNERSLYKRNCDMCKRSIIAMYRPETVFPVYCRECWYGDAWDAGDYGVEYDFSKSFFDQYKELLDKAPRLALFQRNVVNSEYANMIGECKNTYLSISVVLGSENIFYSKGIDACFNIYDSYNMTECDGCYENIQGEKNYNSQYLILSRNCIDSLYLVDCANCSNCILSSNLRNKKFCIRNKQYTKEEYFSELKNLNIGSKISREELNREFKDLCGNAIYRFSNLIQTVDSTGNNLTNVKSCINCFDIHDSENGKNCYRAFFFKDNMDADYAGKSELMYEYTTGAKDGFNVRFTYAAIESTRDAEYSDSIISCTNIFGCVSLRKKEYAILNKVYSKDEFFLLREKIIKHMNEIPYIDNTGIIYKYGEFFPFDLSPFSYNETQARDFLNLSKEEVEMKGYKWYENPIKDFNITLPYQNIPDNINEVDESILNEIIDCEHRNNYSHRCNLAFKITPDELAFYKKNLIPIPTKCSNCRYYERYELVVPAKLWHRNCMKEGCKNEFETPYAPDRPEKVYCEKCYQQEVL